MRPICRLLLQAEGENTSNVLVERVRASGVGLTIGRLVKWRWVSCRACFAVASTTDWLRACATEAWTWTACETNRVVIAVLVVCVAASETTMCATSPSGMWPCTTPARLCGPVLLVAWHTLRERYTHASHDDCERGSVPKHGARCMRPWLRALAGGIYQVPQFGWQRRGDRGRALREHLHWQAILMANMDRVSIARNPHKSVLSFAHFCVAILTVAAQRNKTSKRTRGPTTRATEILAACAGAHVLHATHNHAPLSRSRETSPCSTMDVRHDTWGTRHGVSGPAWRRRIVTRCPAYSATLPCGTSPSTNQARARSRRVHEDSMISVPLSLLVLHASGLEVTDVCVCMYVCVCRELSSGTAATPFKIWCSMASGDCTHQTTHACRANYSHSHFRCIDALAFPL